MTLLTCEVMGWLVFHNVIIAIKRGSSKLVNDKV